MTVVLVHAALARIPGHSQPSSAAYSQRIWLSAITQSKYHTQRARCFRHDCTDPGNFIHVHMLIAAVWDV